MSHRDTSIAIKQAINPGSNISAAIKQAINPVV